MGVFKTIAKVAGTATLSATWLASGMLKKASDAAGFELGSELFGAGNSASATGIKRIWNIEDAEPEYFEENNEEITALQKEKDSKRTAATHCYDMACAAKKAGNEEKYDQFMQRYEDLMAEVAEYDDEIARVENESV